MEQNKTGKYLKYAIGEVVLVVVGILIALSINNWNEGRKTKAIEIKVLTDIKKALISDLDNQFTYQLERIQNFKSHSATILELIEQKSPYDDSLNIRFEVLTSAGRTYWSPQITAYKQLESKGLDLIRNDSLQLAILNIYNHQYLRIETLFENYKQNIYDYGRPFARRNFKTNRGKDLKPIDFKSLSEDVEFYNTVGNLDVNLEVMENALLEIKRNVKEVIKFIDMELYNKK